MNCKHCNSSIDPHARFCSYCGCQIEQTHEAAKPPKGRFWIKLLITCIVIVAVVSMVLSAVTYEPSDTIRDQILKLRGEHYTEAYYNYMAKPFQDTVSLDKFRKFFGKYPMFSTSDTLKIVHENIESNVTTIDAVLSNPQGEHVSVHYRLIKEGEKWKILSMKFDDDSLATRNVKSSSLEIAEGNKVASSKNGDQFDPKPIYETIQNQVKAIKDGDIKGSYNKYASKDFQKVTSYDVYTKFIKGHPAFAENESIKFDKISVENNTVTISGVLISSDDREFPFDYNLVFEDGIWKILHIEVLGEKGKAKKQEAAPKAAEQIQQSGLTFDRFTLGTNVDRNGLISNPSLEFNPDQGPIHLNLFLKNAKTGTDVEVEFQHVDTGAKAPVANAKVPEDGDMVLSFVFTPPSKGWPKGTYRIDAKGSDNAKGSVAFNVE